jgi:signal transduction histidine kinase
MDLEWILRKHGVNNEACVPLLEDALKVLDGLVGTVRQISTELRPELLDALGLRAAIERYVNQFERRSGIHCTVRMPEESTGLTLDQKIAVFRIVQEALTNVARHAQAATVLIALDRKDAGAILTLQDDGVGFILNEADWAKSPGLLGMRERAYLLGADLSIHSVPGRGTSVTLRLPLNR